MKDGDMTRAIVYWYCSECDLTYYGDEHGFVWMNPVCLECGGKCQELSKDVEW